MNAPTAVERTLGRYTLRGELGRGAMSVIHLGYDPRIRRKVALKTLHDDYAERDDYRHRFLTEARAAGTLTHPGIVTIFDVGIADGVPFIAMELLDGVTLDVFVQRHGALSPRMVIKIASQIADALDYAHRHGVVHQDIKPENIAVTSDTGNVKVMDFGIARLRDESDSGRGAALAGQVAGTPHYMSPEQIRRAEVDGRSDIYSLGVLLYWLLSGQKPYRADNVKDLLRAILNEAPAPLKPLNPETPDALVDVVRTLLAKDPAARYQSGSELIEDLGRIDDMLAERERTWEGRRIVPIRVRWTAVMALVVTLTVALGLSFVYHRQNEAMTGLAFDYGLTLTGMLAAETAEDLLLEDHVAIQVLVDEMARNREIVHLAVSDRNGRVVAGSDEGALGNELARLPASRQLLQRDMRSVHVVDDDTGRSYYVFEMPVQYQAHELGRLRVGLATDSLVAANRTTLAALVAVLCATLLAVLVGAYVLSRRLAVPIEILRDALGQITRGRFQSRIRLHRNDEFERVFAAYNTMADSLEARMFNAQSGGGRMGGASESGGRPASDGRRAVAAGLPATEVNATQLMSVDVVVEAGGVDTPVGGDTRGATNASDSPRTG